MISRRPLPQHSGMTAAARAWLAAALCAALFAGMADPAMAQKRAAPKSAAPEEAHVYILRGLLGIFSLGMDTLSAKLKERGYHPYLGGFETWPAIADEIAQRRRAGNNDAIVLIGHSLGADAVVELANKLNAQKIPVDLVVTFDVTLPMVVPANVQRFVNFFQYNGFGRPAEPGPGFKGELNNVDLTADLAISHGTIDKSAQLQALVIDKVLSITDQHMRGLAAKRKGNRS